MNFDEDNIQYNPFGTPEMRIQALAQMLSTLSCNALEYVWRPILYAYQQIDAHEPDGLTGDDWARLSLIGIAAHDTSETIEILWAISNYLLHEELKKEAHS